MTSPLIKVKPTRWVGNLLEETQSSIICMFRSFPSARSSFSSEELLEESNFFDSFLAKVVSDCCNIERTEVIEVSASLATRILN